ncbi:MAG: hypothetical protein AAGJ29_05550, partial [Pseudomonadota bacterium]
ATLRVIDVLGEKQDRYWGLLSAAVVGFAVLAGFFVGNRLSDLRGRIERELSRELAQNDRFREQIGEAIEERVSKGLRESVDRVKIDMAKLQLSLVADQLEAASTFDNLFKSRVMEHVLLVGKDPDALLEASVFGSFKTVVGSFMSADLVDELNEIDEAFRDPIEKLVTSYSSFKDGRRNAIVNLLSVLIQHYGQRWAGSVDVDNSPFEDAFRRYAAYLKKINYYERAMPYYLVGIHASERPKARGELKQLLREYRHLNEDERAVTARVVLGILVDMEKLAKNPTPSLELLVERSVAFRDAHGAMLEADLQKTEEIEHTQA